MKTFNLTTFIATLLALTNFSFAQNTSNTLRASLDNTLYLTDLAYENDEEYSTNYIEKNISEDLLEHNIHSGSRITADGKKIYFFVEKEIYDDTKGQEIAYREKLSNGNWSELKFVDELNNSHNNGVHYVSNSGKKLLLLGEYSKNGVSHNGVSVSELQSDGTWSFPEPLKIKGYHNDQQCSFYMTPSEDVLLLAIRHRNSIGNQDIYVSFKTEEKGLKWSKPMNMGNVINSTQTEGAMFLTTDLKTLYFSTDGRQDSKGGFDIYKSERLDDSWTNWSTPVNIGAPYNTEHDEFYYSTSENDNYEYLSRHFVDSDSIHHSDIFAYKKKNSASVLTVNAYDFETNSPLNASITIMDVQSGRAVNTNSGTTTTIPCDKTYKVVSTYEGYLSESANVSVDCFDDASKDIFLSLKPKKEGVSWEIENIFFAFDEARLLNQSIPALDKVVSLLRNERDIKVEISGHTDAQGKDHYNKKLSQERAEAVVNYLIDNGISTSQLKAAGYGEDQLKNDCENGVDCSDDEHQENRRVEFKILKINTL